MTISAAGRGQKLPSWFKVSLSTSPRYAMVRNRIRANGLHTVCEGAACPNRNECWNAGTATFLLLGSRCTRACRFCNIPSGDPLPVDHDEPQRVAVVVRDLSLAHAVVTSVTRDDLSDGGASIFSETVLAIRCLVPECSVEVLIPDFQGSESALDMVLHACPDVLNHNIETVPSFYSAVRPGASYERSLRVLDRARERGAVTKSGLMVGLGESLEQIHEVMADLRKAGCMVLTVGQYLRPRKDLMPVVRFYHPEEFLAIREKGIAMGFRDVVAAPLARSSYHAAESMRRSRIGGDRAYSSFEGNPSQQVNRR